MKGNSTDPHSGEDQDTYRFLEETSADLGCELVVLNDGRDIWQVMRDKKFLSNSRIAHCSQELKQRPARRWLKANCDPADTTVVFGIDGTEAHRMKAITKQYAPYGVAAPLINVMMTKPEMMVECESYGIKPPRLYEAGFPHNNCGGGCVRAGQAHWRLLLKQYPERYKWWEEQEQGMRDFLQKDVAIIVKRLGYKKGLRGDIDPIPLPLKEFRLQIEAGAGYDKNDWGGCGCFLDDLEEK